MFDIGFWELILIAVIGLVVLGPERLPVAIRNLSRTIGAMRRMAGSVRDELEQELKLKELRDNLKKAEEMNMKNLSPDLQESIDALKEAAQEVQRPFSSKDVTTSEDATKKAETEKS